MANYIGGVNTVCPFYIREAEFSITCEGCTQAQNAVSVRFLSPKEKESWQEKYCETFSYRQCPIAQMLLKKYGEEA